MRVIGIMSLALATALFSLGCEKANSASATKPRDTKPSDTKMDEAQKKAKEAAEAAAAAAKAKRDEYVKDMNKQLDALNVKYDEWKAKAAKAEGQAKKDLEKKLDEMKVKRDAATKKLNEVKEASLDRWEKVKEGFGTAFEDLKKIFD